MSQRGSHYHISHKLLVASLLPAKKEAQAERQLIFLSCCSLCAVITSKGKYSSFGRSLLRGSQLTIGGLHTTDIKMPKEPACGLTCAHAHIMRAHADTNLQHKRPYAETTPLLRAFSPRRYNCVPASLFSSPLLSSPLLSSPSVVTGSQMKRHN